MQFKYIFLTIIFLLQFKTSWGQNAISDISSIPEKKEKSNFISRYFNEDYPSPKKAVVLTAIIPGLGQIYNKKHWYIKLPIIYGAFGGIIYSIQNNGRKYRGYEEQYRFQVDELDSTTSIYNGRVSDAVLRNKRDLYQKRLHLSYIGIGLAYILTAAEAYTTAHLLSFDVSDDLSMQFKPSFDVNPRLGMTAGVGVRFTIGKNKKIIPKIILK